MDDTLSCTMCLMVYRCLGSDSRLYRDSKVELGIRIYIEMKNVNQGKYDFKILKLFCRKLCNFTSYKELRNDRFVCFSIKMGEYVDVHDMRLFDNI